MRWFLGLAVLPPVHRRKGSQVDACLPDRQGQSSRGQLTPRFRTF